MLTFDVEEREIAWLDVLEVSIYYMVKDLNKSLKLEKPEEVFFFPLVFGFLCGTLILRDGDMSMATFQEARARPVTKATSLS